MIEGPVFEPELGWGGRLNAWFQSNMLFSVALAAIIIVAIVLLVMKGVPDRRNLATSIPLSSPSQAPTISETVRPGDSYTLIARRMISQIQVTLQPGQALYGETILAKKIQNQPLKAGLRISIPMSLVEKTLATFSSLSELERQHWARLQRQLHP